MADIPDPNNTSPIELIGEGRRHLAVRDYNAAAETLAKACELLAKEHGDTADQCAEAYLWYGKALLGLSREESGVLGDGMPGANASKEDAQADENGEAENSEEENKANGDETEKTDEKMCVDKQPEQNEPEKLEVESDEKAKNNSNDAQKHNIDEPATNGEVDDETDVNLDNEDDVDNLQLAWEMLDLARSILRRRVDDGGGETARSLLAETHLSLGEVALESETYDKAVIDMQSSLALQKELYSSNDRRIAETHYQIGLANSLASNFEEAITHFKNAANILESRIKSLENPKDDAAAKKLASNDSQHSAQDEIKELRELLPEIQEKIQDMMDYKAETIKRVREALCPTNGAGSSSSSTNGAGPSSAEPKPKPAASDISHLIKRKRKSSESESGASAPKRANT